MASLRYYQRWIRKTYYYDGFNGEKTGESGVWESVRPIRLKDMLRFEPLPADADRCHNPQTKSLKMKTTTSQWIICAIFACSLAGSPLKTLAQETPVTNLVSLTTFDYDFDTGVGHNLRWNYGYKYDWGGEAPAHSYFFNTAFYDPDDWGFTNAMGQFYFDNAGYADFMIAYPGGGYGFGFGGGLNWTNDASIFTATNREDYIISFRARAEGLKAGVTTANGEFQVQFAAPDNTIQPPDANTDDDMLMQVNLNFSVSSNWQTFVFTLDQGGIADGKTEADFIAYRFQDCNPRFNVNFHQPEGGWDFDADNTFYLDDIRLEVVQKAPPPPPPPTVPVVMLEWNMDDKPGWGYYGGYNWSQNANLPIFTYNEADAGAGVGGSNGWSLRMDNSSLAAEPPQWAGGGTGGSGPVDYSLFSSGDLGDYLISFDARVEGLDPATLSTSLTLQVFLRAPDDTLEPADADTDNDLLVRLDFAVPAGTNWQTTSYTLRQGNAGVGSKANFTEHASQIHDMNMQFQIENANSLTTWGYDADNALIVDNIKLERLLVGCPPLSVAASGENIVVTWANPATGTVQLQSATNVNGPFSEVAGATSPYSTPIAGAPKYFRTVWVPPTP